MEEAVQKYFYVLHVRAQIGNRSNSQPLLSGCLVPGALNVLQIG